MSIFTFILIVIVFFLLCMSSLQGLFSGSAFLALMLLCFVLGVFLIYLVTKQMKKNKLNKYLILTGASASGTVASIVLHNMLYALSIVINHVPLFKSVVDVFQVIFFLIAVLVCPIGLLAGVFGVLFCVLFNKKP